MQPLKLRVSFGNKKLPDDTMIWNIPARTTCPGRTELCAGKCYALKAERVYPQVLPARQANFDATRAPGFVPDMMELIAGHVDRGKVKRIRVHESGDFYNQEYLNRWFLIASEFPSIRFYAYTKSFHLDFSACPDNFWLIASFDKSTPAMYRERYDTQARYFKNSFTIVDRGARATCVQDCSVCNACWTKTGKRITVNQH